MRNKILFKFLICFALLLALFAIAIGSVFSWLFTRYSTDHLKRDLEATAVRIADTVTEYISAESVVSQDVATSNSTITSPSETNDTSRQGGGNCQGGGNGQGQSHAGSGSGSGSGSGAGSGAGSGEGSDGGSGHTGQSGLGSMAGQVGFGMYLKLLNEIVVSDVWIVDKDSKLITRGQGQAQITYAQLPADAEAVIAQALAGQAAFSESFSEFLTTKSITVGVPIKGDQGTIMGVVLLHAPVDGISVVTDAGSRILVISILVALFLSGIAAVWLSYYFSKPLKKMRSTALKLSQGDYLAKTGVRQSDEIGQLAQTLDILSGRLLVASQESENLEKMRQEFISNISHELRTPVTVIRGSLEALCDEIIQDPEQVKSYYEQMLSESIQLQRLVNDLLDLSRLQNADFKMTVSEINVVEVIQDITRSMTHIAKQKNLEIEVNNEFYEYKMEGDYSRLRQMLMIVVDNAIKFSPAKETIIISLIAHNGCGMLSIEDHGKGILVDELPYIFDRFYKNREEANSGGTGLGLAIAKQIAQKHGITITVTSEPKIKTVFCFTLPAKIN